MKSPLRSGNGRKFILALALILLTGGVLQSWVAASLWGQADEGAYIQTALVMSHGGIPGVTFPARPEPVLPLLLLPALALFGYALIVGRAVIILINFITAGLLAILARKLVLRHGDVAGLATAAIYLIAPLAAMQGPTILEEPVAALFITLSLLFLLRNRWAESRWNYPLSGLFLGVAILSRRSAVVVGLAWLFWIFLSERSWRTRVLSAARCFWPGVLLVGAYVFAIVRATSISWLLDMYGVQAAQYEYVPDWASKIEVFGYLLFVATPLLLIPAAMAIRMLRVAGRQGLATVVTTLSTATVSGLLIAYPFEVQWGLGELLTSSLLLLTACTLVVWLALILRENLIPPGPVPLERRFFLLLLGWTAFFLGLDFLVRPEAFSVYIADATAPLALIFGAWFATLVPDKDSASVPRRRKLALHRNVLARTGPTLSIVLLLTVSSSLTALLVLGPTNPQNVAGANGLPDHSIYRDPGSEIQNVGAFLRTNMKPDDRIFTFDSIFADASGRAISPPVGQYLDNYVSYVHHDRPPGGELYPGSPAGFLPSIRALLSYWNSTNLSWFVEGPLTMEALADSPLLQWYVNTFYHPVATFGDPLSYDEVIVLGRGGPPVPTVSPLGTIIQGSTPVALTFAQGAIYSASLNSSFLTYRSVNGSSGTITLPFPGARSLGYYFGYLWIGSTLTSQIEILPLGGGPAELLTVGSGPSAFAADVSSRMVFVATVSSSNVTALSMTSNQTWWGVAWKTSVGRGLTGLAVNSSARVLYVASPGTEAILTLNETNGRLLHVSFMPFPPFSLVYADGGLVASWWIGWIYRLGVEANGSLVVMAKTFTGKGAGNLDLLAALDAVAVPSEQQGTVSLLGARTLVLLGNFTGIPCPNYVRWVPGNQWLATAQTCQGETTLWRTPAPTSLKFSGPPGTTVTVEGRYLFASYPLPVTVEVWAQAMSLTTSRVGYLPGFAEISISQGTGWLNVTLPVGPSLTGIGHLVLDFALAASGFSAGVFLGALWLLYRYEEADLPNGRDAGPPRSSAP